MDWRRYSQANHYAFSEFQPIGEWHAPSDVAKLVRYKCGVGQISRILDRSELRRGGRNSVVAAPGGGMAEWAGGRRHSRAYYLRPAPEYCRRCCAFRWMQPIG